MAPADQHDQPQAASAEAGNGIRGYFRRRVSTAKQAYSGSSTQDLMQRLGSADVVNQGIVFAATLLLCLFPFLIIANALAGRSTASGLARRLGLNNRAAADLGHLFASSASTSRAVTGASWIFFILGGIAAAMAIQQIYERAFGMSKRGMKDMVRQLVWLAALVGCGALSDWAGPRLHRSLPPVLPGLIGLLGVGGFWWFSMWFLLGGRVPWRSLFPAAVATTLYWLGMQIVFHFTFSSMIISNYSKYGAIGIVFALLSWLISIGVVIILGAVTGIVWQDRNLSFAAALRRVSRRPGAREPADPEPADPVPGAAPTPSSSSARPPAR